jgi:hypothetical protein
MVAKKLVLLRILLLFSPGKESLKLVSYRGNRFNILFYDSAALFHHRSHLDEFFRTWPKQNNLVSAVYEDLQSKVNVAGVRALGIIDTHHRTALEDFGESVLDVNPHLLNLKLGLEQYSKDASPLMDGECPFSSDVAEIHKDALYLALFQSEDDQLDCLTQECLEMLSHSLLLVLERQAQDQLPGGKYFQPSEELKKQASSVPTTNTISERDDDDSAPVKTVNEVSESVDSESVDGEAVTLGVASEEDDDESVPLAAEKL